MTQGLTPARPNMPACRRKRAGSAYPFHRTSLLRSMLSAALVTVQLLSPNSAFAQQSGLQTALPRLASTVLDVAPPSSRVSGNPGNMQIIERSCRSLPLDDVRRRIVNTATQEWAFFGFQVDDQRNLRPPTSGPQGPGNFSTRRFALLDPVETARVAASVGGYWAAAPGSDWILQRQNEAWQSANGLASRYRDPWSAAFISWVMCESGLGDAEKFQRAIAHHSYIDQAIRARDAKAPDAAFVAYDPGEQAIVPGDMLCSGMRPVYRSLAQRRAQLGVGARTHCDIVVEVNDSAGQILTIGGNVRSSVRMKIFPAAVGERPHLAPLPTSRYIFAHLKLKSAPIEAQALSNTPTLLNMACTLPAAPVALATASVAMPAASC